MVHLQNSNIQTFTLHEMSFHIGQVLRMISGPYANGTYEIDDFQILEYPASVAPDALGTMCSVKFIKDINGQTTLVDGRVNADVRAFVY